MREPHRQVVAFAEQPLFRSAQLTLDRLAPEREGPEVRHNRIGPRLLRHPALRGVTQLDLGDEELLSVLMDLVLGFGQASFGVDEAALAVGGPVFCVAPSTFGVGEPLFGPPPNLDGFVQVLLTRDDELLKPSEPSGDLGLVLFGFLGPGERFAGPTVSLPRPALAVLCSLFGVSDSCIGGRGPELDLLGPLRFSSNLLIGASGLLVGEHAIGLGPGFGLLQRADAVEVGAVLLLHHHEGRAGDFELGGRSGELLLQGALATVLGADPAFQLRDRACQRVPARFRFL